MVSFFDLSGKPKQLKRRFRDPIALLRAFDALAASPAGRELFGPAGESRAFTQTASGLATAGEGLERQARETAARAGLGRSFAEAATLTSRLGTAGAIAREAGGATRERAARTLDFGTQGLGVLGETQNELQTLFQAAKARSRERKAAKRIGRAQTISSLAGMFGGPPAQAAAGSYFGLFGGPESSLQGASNVELARQERREQQRFDQFMKSFGSNEGGEANGGGLDFFSIFQILKSLGIAI